MSIKQLLATVLLFIFTGCASVSQTSIQDGRALGKGSFRFASTGESGPMLNQYLTGPDFANPDEFAAGKDLLEPFTESLELSEQEIEDLEMLLSIWPIAGLNFQYGATDQIDVGLLAYAGGMGMNFGGKLYGKYAFMKEGDKLQAAIVPSFGYGITTFKVDTVSYPTFGASASPSIFSMSDFTYGNMFIGLEAPMSFHHKGDKFATLYFSPRLTMTKIGATYNYFGSTTSLTPSKPMAYAFGFGVGFDNPRIAGKNTGRQELVCQWEKSPITEKYAPNLYLSYTYHLDILTKGKFTMFD